MGALKGLNRRLASIAGRVDGVMGIAVQDVQTGEEIGTRADEPFPMASVCKTPILVHTYRLAETNQVSLQSRLVIEESSRTPGSGLFNYFDAGLAPTLSDLLLMMIVVSDNAATDLVLGQVGGPAAVTQTMQALGLSRIRLDRTIYELLDDIGAAMDPGLRGLNYAAREAIFVDNPELTAKFQDMERVREGVTVGVGAKDTATPRHIARLYAQIARNECASASSCEAMLKTLERQVLRGRLPRELPPNVRMHHKTGTLGYGAVTNDSGLLRVGERLFSIAVLSKSVKQPPHLTNTAIARIGRTIYHHLAEKSDL